MKELFAIASLIAAVATAQDDVKPWSQLPLVTDGKIDASWVHVGWGGFVVDDGALRSDPDPRGLGLLVFAKEKFGDCQLRVVFKQKDAKSNSGFYVRVDDGILDQTNKPGAAFDRSNGGKPTPDSRTAMIKSCENDEGPWYAVHHGYEVQILDDKDNFHRTGAIYSYVPSKTISTRASDEWKTMIVTLAGNKILVELDGKRITTFDPDATNLPKRVHWAEPKREPKRPQHGYIGLQNHDPGELVWFKEVAVRPRP